MGEELQKAEEGAKKAWPVVQSWVGGVSALIGLFASIAGGYAWFVNHHQRNVELQSKMALAQAQVNQGEYQSAVQSYADILKTDILYRPALDQQLNTAMLWIENFSVAAPEGQSTSGAAASALDEIFPILDAGLTRAKGAQAADIQAHIGWAHWLNERIAEKEFGDVAEQDLRAALTADPTNVYANAMLGGWMIQAGRDFTEANQHFNTAVSTGKARPFVRKLQLGSLTYLDKPGARAAQVIVANDMRKNGEPIDDEYRSRILGFCFDPIVTDHGELKESLSAVPPDEAWQTYLWLDNNPGNPEDHHLVHEFIQANLLEISGKPQESLEKYRVLQQELKNSNGTMSDSVNAAVKRLSHG